MGHPNNIATNIIFLFLFVVLISCRQQNHKENESNTTKVSANGSTQIDSNSQVGNINTTISTDIGKLGRLLDFTIYKPTKVKFKYIYADNSGESQRLTVPGPSDYYLQALLYFDSLTFAKFRDFDKNADYPSPDYNRQTFMFEWLDEEVKNELSQTDTNYHGHPDFFFKTTNSKLWYLDKKILISMSSN